MGRTNPSVFWPTPAIITLRCARTATITAMAVTPVTPILQRTSAKESAERRNGPVDSPATIAQIRRACWYENVDPSRVSGIAPVRAHLRGGDANANGSARQATRLRVHGKHGAAHRLRGH